MGSETESNDGSSNFVGREATMSRFEAGSTNIRPDVLRGARASSVLGQFGALWRTSPIDLPPEVRARLWSKSKTCESLDAFVSQTWNAPGWQKYITLLLHFYWVPAALSGLAALLALSFLDVLGFLPTLHFDGDVWVFSKFSPWGIVPIAMPLVVLVLAPAMPCLRDPLLFFDAVCINQTDETLLTEGIYSLAGFIANSRGLIVLWSTSYLKRAWCVLELAVFTALNEGKAICLRPLFVSTTLFIGCIVTTACIHISLAANYLGALSGYAVLSNSLGILFGLPVPMFVHNLRLHYVEMQDLTTQLAEFRLENAQCRLERDVDFVSRNVDAFWGSKHSFEQMVRENLRSQLMASQHDFEFKYVHFLVMTLPATINFLPQVISLAKTGPPPSHLLSAIVYFDAIALLFAPSMVKFVFVICRICAKQHENKAVNYGVDIGVALLAILSAVCAVRLSGFFRRTFHLGGFMSAGLGAIVTPLAFGARYHQFCSRACRNVQATTSQ